MKDATSAVGVLVVSDGQGMPEPATSSANPDALTDAALTRVRPVLRDGESVGRDADGRIVLQISDGGKRRQLRRMNALTRELVRAPLMNGDQAVQVDVGAGWAQRVRRLTSRQTVEHAVGRAQESLDSRDLMVRTDVGSDHARKPGRNVTGYQIALSLLLSLLLPFAILVTSYRSGFDISTALYWLLVVALGSMVVLQWGEALSALRPPKLPDDPGGQRPRASAVIAAYLPNEAETIIETLRAFLAQQYSGGLQIILAYNTPEALPIEEELRELAAKHPDLLLLNVEGSTSKAQNVNAALARVDGEFVGIFDADHHPMVGAFERAWRWIGSGVDVVQGHCVVRNGGDSLVSRIVAVEFEQIYAVSHPGRQLMHGFGVFGGSNGFWRTQVLRETRLRTRFLTEDIDSAIRAVRAGQRIVNDPGLVSRELAPDTPRALWKQRMRWAQGWFQVSCNHVQAAFADRGLTVRQRFGMLFLLGWREIFPWLSSLMWPLLAFFLWRDGSLAISSPALLLTTLFTLSCGAVQVLFAHRLGVPEIRQKRRWWLLYLLGGGLIYQEAKNLVARVAQIKQLMGERHWAVTPRRAATPQTPAKDGDAA